MSQADSAINAVLTKEFHVDTFEVKILYILICNVLAQLEAALNVLN